VKNFIKTFRDNRIFLGIPQTDVARQISESSGQHYTQSFISNLECGKLNDQTVLAIRPLLEKSLKQKKKIGKKYIHLTNNRKKRTTFSQEARLLLLTVFQQNTRPSMQQISQLSNRIGVDKQTVQLWFQNRVQRLKRKSFNNDRSTNHTANHQNTSS